MAIIDKYRQIEKEAWTQYPDELRETSEYIKLLEGINPREAQKILKQHPEILQVRKVIALQKRLTRQGNVR